MVEYWIPNLKVKGSTHRETSIFSLKSLNIDLYCSILIAGGGYPKDFAKNGRILNTKCWKFDYLINI